MLLLLVGTWPLWEQLPPPGPAAVATQILDASGATPNILLFSSNGKLSIIVSTENAVPARTLASSASSSDKMAGGSGVSSSSGPLLPLTGPFSATGPPFFLEALRVASAYEGSCWAAVGTGGNKGEARFWSVRAGCPGCVSTSKSEPDSDMLGVPPQLSTPCEGVENTR